MFSPASPHFRSSGVTATFFLPPVRRGAHPQVQRIDHRSARPTPSSYVSNSLIYCRFACYSSGICTSGGKKITKNLHERDSQNSRRAFAMHRKYFAVTLGSRVLPAAFFISPGVPAAAIHPPHSMPWGEGEVQTCGAEGTQSMQTTGLIRSGAFERIARSASSMCSKP